jgi:hypothetical protein
MDRSALWNGAEDAEPRCRAVVAREMDVALPHELSKIEQNFACAEDMADWLIERYRCGVDIAYHRAIPEGGPRPAQFSCPYHVHQPGADPRGLWQKDPCSGLPSKPATASSGPCVRLWQDIVNARLRQGRYGSPHRLSGPTRHRASTVSRKSMSG